MHWTYHALVLDLTQVLSVQHLSQVGGDVTVDNCAASVLASAMAPVLSPEQNMFKVRLRAQKDSKRLVPPPAVCFALQDGKIHVLP